jgi:hypothetical protein
MRIIIFFIQSQVLYSHLKIIGVVYYYCISVFCLGAKIHFYRQQFVIKYNSLNSNIIISLFKDEPKAAKQFQVKLNFYIFFKKVRYFC